MSNVQTNSQAQVKSASIRAVRLRCTCGHPETHFGQVCPQAVEEPLGVDGVVAHYNSDPAAQHEFNVALAAVEGRPVQPSTMVIGIIPPGRIRAWVIRTLLKLRNRL